LKAEEGSLHFQGRLSDEAVFFLVRWHRHSAVPQGSNECAGREQTIAKEAKVSYLNIWFSRRCQWPALRKY
jgi:hypothetical protein